MAKRTKSKLLNRPRKAPSQDRARATVDIILEATRQCLEKNGIKGMTTTRVAERAGVSVGTIYQYYPSREALVAALVEDFGGKEAALIEFAIGKSPAGDLGAVLGEVIRLYFAGVAHQQKLFLPLMRALYTICSPEVIERLELEGVERIRQLLVRYGCARKDLEKSAFLISYSYIGLLRFCSTVRPHYLSDPEFVSDVVEMIATYATASR